MSGSTITLSRTSGGIPVVVESLPGSQSAAFMIGVATGSRDEHPGIFGLSHLLEHTVFRETETRDSYQMAKEMEGARIRRSTRRTPSSRRRSSCRS